MWEGFLRSSGATKLRSDLYLRKGPTKWEGFLRSSGATKLRSDPIF